MIFYIFMKFKKKLVTDNDGEPVSPQILLDNVVDSSRSIESFNTFNANSRGRTSY